MGNNEKFFCVGFVASAHGVRGEFSIRPFLENISLLTTSPIYDEKGNILFSISITGQKKDLLIAKADNITDRNASESIRGKELFLPADILPETDKDEFYHSQLVGLIAQTENGEKIGVVGNILNFGAGDIVEIKMESGEIELFPFSSQWVKGVDLKNGFIIVSPVEYLEEMNITKM